MSERDHCRGCGETIVWALSPAGKPMPLTRVRTIYTTTKKPLFKGLPSLENPPNPRQPYEFVALHAVKLAVEAPPGEGLYVSHFETCPDRQGFRRKKTDG